MGSPGSDNRNPGCLAPCLLRGLVALPVNQKQTARGVPVSKRIFILIDKTDSEFFDRIVKAIQETEKGRRDRTVTPGPLPYGSQGPRRLKE